MTRRTRFVLAVLAALGVLTAAFLLLDFRAAASESRSDAQISAFSSGNHGQQATRPVGKVELYVPGDDPISGSLRRRLPKALESDATFGGAELVPSPESEGRGPVVMVELADPNLLWTPLHTRAEVVARVYYASNGDLSWREQTSVHMSSEMGPVRFVRGEVRLSDTTSGVISLPAYRSHLAEQISLRVVERLAAMAPGGG